MSTPVSKMRLKRILAGKTLDELGLEIGVSSSFLSRVERGFARLSPEKERELREALAARSKRGVGAGRV